MISLDKKKLVDTHIKKPQINLINFSFNLTTFTEKIEISNYCYPIKANDNYR